MIQWSHVLLFVAATLSAQHVAAQTKAEIQAEGVELGKAVQATAGGIVKDSASPETIVPGYAGTTLPEANLFDDADALAAQGAALKSGSEAYSVATTPNAASIDPATLDVALGTAIEQDPDEDDPDPACQVKERTYSCKKAGGPDGQPAYLCAGDLYCIDGECTQVAREASTEFKDAMVAVHTLGDVRDQFDADTLTLFSGAKEGCHKPVFGLVNCCAGRVSGLLSAGVGFGAIASGPVAVAALATPFLSMFMCSNEEKLLDVKDRMGLCHRVGTYCSAKALFVCTTKRTNYCCYESKLARVLQEQGRNQLGKGWGTAKKPICDGFTIEEFQQLDLSVMDFTEVYDDFMEAAKVPDEIQTSLDIQEKIQAYYELHSN